MKVSHPANVLKAKVPDLSAPPAKEEKRPLEKWGLLVIWSYNQFVIKLSPQEEGGESQHSGNVPHPDVTYVDTPGFKEMWKLSSVISSVHLRFYGDNIDDKNNQPIQCELLQVCEVTSDVLKSSVGDSRTPRYVKAHLGLYLISQHCNCLNQNSTHLPGRPLRINFMSRYICFSQIGPFDVSFEELFSKVQNPGGFFRKIVF